MEAGHVALLGTSLEDWDPVSGLAQPLLTLQDVLLNGGAVVSRRVPPAHHKYTTSLLVCYTLHKILVHERKVGKKSRT